MPVQSPCRKGVPCQIDTAEVIAWLRRRDLAKAIGDTKDMTVHPMARLIGLEAKRRGGDEVQTADDTQGVFSSSEIGEVAIASLSTMRQNQKATPRSIGNQMSRDR